MKIYVIYLILYFGVNLFPAIATEDKVEELWDQADEYLFDENYEKAVPYLLQLDSLKPNTEKYKFLLAKSYYNSRLNKIAGIPYAKQYIALEGNDADPEIYYYLGQLNHLDYNFEEAKLNYQNFLSKAKKNHDLRPEVERELATLDEAEKKVNNPNKYKIRSIGENINSNYPDYVPVISADESVLIFTSRRPGSTGGLQNDRGEPDTVNGEYFEDIYITSKVNDSTWGSPVSIGPNINTTGHDASIGLSPDGQQLFLYKSDGIKFGNIYSSNLIGTEWQIPEQLPYPINTRYWEGSASIAPDGRTMYFASNRPGGYGGKDLYMIKKLPDGSWAQPKNLGPEINTSTDDDAPFIHPDGKTLYFSSKGHESIGGYDIFITSEVELYKWATPRNMGYPVNTTDHDIYFVLSASGERGYYSSVADEGKKSEDIFVIDMLESEYFKPQPLTVLKGFIKSVETDSMPENIKIEVYDNETGEEVGIFKPNTSTGKYIIIVPHERDYNIAVVADGHLFHSENIKVPTVQADYIEIKKDIYLQSIKKGSKIILNNIFFNFNESTLRESSLLELERVIDIMKKDSNLVIAFLGHTDAKGDFNYNKKLSQERAQVALDYVASQGINRNRMIGIGYGESQPVAVNYYFDGSDNEMGRQLNRRTELEIISTKGENINKLKINQPSLEHKMVYKPIQQEQTANDTMYGVTIGISDTAYIPPREFFTGFNEVYTDKTADGKTIYMIGNSNSYIDVKSLEQKAIKLGIKNPEIVAYKDGKQVTLDNSAD